MKKNFYEEIRGLRKHGKFDKKIKFVNDYYQGVMMKDQQIYTLTELARLIRKKYFLPVLDGISDDNTYYILNHCGPVSSLEYYRNFDFEDFEADEIIEMFGEKLFYPESEVNDRLDELLITFAEFSA